MLAQKSDDELMLLVKQGDEAAFALLFRRHGSAVFGLCMRFFSGNRARAEDVAQEAWAKVVRYARSYEPRGQFKSWLMQITRNSALREIEKNQAAFQMSREEDVEVADAFNLEENMVERHREQEVKAAIDGLPEAQRTALVLWLDGTRSYEEIAKELKASVPGVKSLLFRAKQSLVKRLEER